MPIRISLFHRTARPVLTLSAWLSLCAVSSAHDSATLEPVLITGNPLGASEIIAPAEQLSNSELVQRGQPSLGETLKGLPGLSSTYFGPNASRPVIRGLDGDRIGILNNGGSNNDLSALSYDHALTLDPLLIERIEVLRGPGVLQYGGSAVGGVVNVIDGRIHREPLFDEQGGVVGKLDAGLASGNQERGGAVVLDAGTRRYSLHVDAMARRTEDVAVPIELSCTRNGSTTTARRICNSASESSGGALGGTLFFDRGYLGSSLSTYSNNYGSVAEDETSIRMRSNKLDLEGELRDLGPLLQSVKAQYSRSDYQHTEYEADVAGTQFRSEGQDLRLQARHARFGRLDGVLGLQFEHSKFSADGSEAYAPYSSTRANALYAYEELGLGWGKLSAGARLESTQVQSMGIPGEARFVPATRNFMPTSYALGGLWNLASEWQLSSNLSWNERAPKHYELFANGEHVATNAEEIGNPDLGKEASANIDLGLAWRRSAHRAKLQVFQNRFGNYIALQGTDLGADPPQYSYTQVQARFIGFEASGNARLLDAGQTLDLNLRADSVRAENTTTGEPLPRIAPWRLGATLLWSQAAWSARLGAEHYADQNDVPTGQSPTAGYTLWSAALSLRQRLMQRPALWYVRLDNATDTLAYSASSILTQTVPGRVPLPGRSLKMGLQLSF